ncbi:MAG: sulfatase-like hydrolase/transferase [Flavobacteriaceae bacterium]|jgi:phosphoglycerol transferase MdoB-like AlkP superfamily enzyme|nr:sulfatase-like hydrolase/transferase [Flavobacteriaceae bacterium]
MNSYLFSNLLKKGVKYFCFFFVVFFVARLFFLGVYGNSTELQHEKIGLIRAFLVGARFDVSAISYGFLPIMLLCLIALAIPSRFNKQYAKFFHVFSLISLLLVLVAYLSLIIIDFFFYQFFQSHINLLFFGIFYDDTSAVLDSVWTDYPIFKIGFIYLVVIVLWIGVAYYIKKRDNIKLLKKESNKEYLWFVILPLFFLGMRGSAGEFTLRREHTNVSTNEFVNSLGYNAIYSLKFANSERKENIINPDINALLANLGFTSKSEAQEVYRKGTSAAFDEDLQSITATNEFLEHNPPNVIFLQMESMSNHYFDLNNEKFNLLGELNDVLPELYYFKNGLSSNNGTIQTLENLVLGTPQTIISQSIYFDTPFSTSIAKPFKSKGYDTYFLTGANISWRNIDKMLQHQEFDFLEGSNAILNKIPNAEEFAWGVHDGFLFDYIFDKLKESDGKKPKFIFGLTISNHTPFEIPSNYKAFPIEMSKEIKSKIRIDEEMAYANFYSHQYAASELGRLIKAIKASPYGENTIVVASGDHNIRQVFEYTPEEGFLKRSVPILFYIPEKYKPTFFDGNVLAAHKDIFPTIFNLSLSNAKYTYTGDNLFDKNQTYRFALNGYEFIADDKGAVSMENNKPYYYIWANQEKRKLKVQKELDQHGQIMLDKMKSIYIIQSIKIFEDINAHQKAKR